ncbi:hypothetical protein Csa_010737 [Cucumis sativus]|uniref:Uncharacterized protein n=1 Tax=Cucumis sativus TaxID=3659 RepID=A0A0A0LAR7_CUCSA|nr:hypothetical protein Csa_010737 [Cucumis sativus]
MWQRGVGHEATCNPTPGLVPKKLFHHNYCVPAHLGQLGHPQLAKPLKSPPLNKLRSVPFSLSLSLSLSPCHRSLLYNSVSFLPSLAVTGGLDLICEVKKAVRTGFVVE